MFIDAFWDPASGAGAPPGRAFLDRLFVGRTSSRWWQSPTTRWLALCLRGFERERVEVYLHDPGFAAAFGAWAVDVQADRDDGPAIALYTKRGRREDVLNFDVAVPPA